MLYKGCLCDVDDNNDNYVDDDCDDDIDNNCSMTLCLCYIVNALCITRLVYI